MLLLGEEGVVVGDAFEEDGEVFSQTGLNNFYNVNKLDLF